MTNSPLVLSPGVPAYAALRDVIRADIMAGRLPAGTRLTTASLVERFGISQMPVREALQALEGEGLITILPHKGATVLSLDAKRVSDIYDLRGAVESLLVRRSVPNLTNAAMKQLRQIHAELSAAVAAGNSSEVFALNTRFHTLINRHADNPEAIGVYDRYVNIVGSLRTQYGFSQFRMQQMEEEHEQILAALLAQDEDRLDAIIRLHVEGAKEDLIERMQAAAPARTGTG